VYGSAGAAALGASGPIVLSTHDLDMPFKAGARFLAGHTFGDSPFQVEFSYFAVESWDSSAEVRDTSSNALGGQGNLFSPFTDFGNPAVDGVDYNNLVSIRETSTLEGGELNLLRELPVPPGRLTAALLIGARQLTIREQFNYSSQAAVPLPLGASNWVITRTRNELWGAQIGGLFRCYIEDRWWLDLSIKGAIFNNAALQQSWYQNIDSGGATHDYYHERSGCTTAYLGDLALTLVYRWSPWLTTRIGYQSMWVEGLALASENFHPPLSILTLGPGQLVNTGKTVYHGIHAGVEFTW